MWGTGQLLWALPGPGSRSSRAERPCRKASAQHIEEYIEQLGAAVVDVSDKKARVFCE
ncbi:hypothetical protein ACTMTI_03660 [Nonomuraea sp. H19]|uniref:hypothetical protein n=1 Tax=Nonomuraea sp. H19 TaxID=3452206 RepID=UPI003F88C081